MLNCQHDFQSFRNCSVLSANECSVESLLLHVFWLEASSMIRSSWMMIWLQYLYFWEGPFCTFSDQQVVVEYLTCRDLVQVGLLCCCKYRQEHVTPQQQQQQKFLLDTTAQDFAWIQAILLFIKKKVSSPFCWNSTNLIRKRDGIYVSGKSL